MLLYCGKRLLLMIPVILGVIIFVFLFQSLAPGDLVDAMYADATPERQAELRAAYGLNDPIVVQCGRYIWNLVTKFDMGQSFRTGNSVSQELLSRFSYTLILAFGGVGVGMLLGIPLGILAAVKQYSWLDSTILTGTVVGSSIPNFWLALLLLWLFAVILGWVPVSGVSNVKGWILPMITVMIPSMSMLARITRASMLESIRQDFVRTARAKGQKEYLIVIKHALRNSIMPIISTIGNSFGVQLGGALIAETIFAIPGVGRYAVTAVNTRDFNAVCGSVILLAMAFSVVNLLVDVCYVLVDSRMKTNFTTTRRAIRRLV